MDKVILKKTASWNFCKYILRNFYIFIKILYLTSSLFFEWMKVLFTTILTNIYKHQIAINYMKIEFALIKKLLDICNRLRIYYGTWFLVIDSAF